MMEESRNTFKIVTNLVGYHLFDFRPGAEIMPFCRENNMGIMAYDSGSRSAYWSDVAGDEVRG